MTITHSRVVYGVLALWTAVVASAAPPSVFHFDDATPDDAPLFSTEPESVQFRLTDYLLQEEPERPVQPLVSSQLASLRSSPASQLGGMLDLELLRLDPPRQKVAEAAGGAPEVIAGTEAAVRNTTDANDLIVSSQSTTDVAVHSRSSISHDPRIRGYRMAEVRSIVDGAVWVPLRPDFDTPLSRVPSSIIRDAVVLKGPFSVRYGPGFTFLDVALQDTPRNADGPSWKGRTSLNYDTNGQRWNGRQTVMGGGASYGFRAAYGHTTGNDYDSGAGFGVAGSFNSRDVDFALGFDLAPDSKLQFGYQRLDQTKVELPAQYFDIDFLTSDSCTLRYTCENSTWFRRVSVDSWWNSSRFEGNQQKLTKPGVLAIFGPLSFLADNGNVGEVASTGARAAATWGETDAPQLTAGSDLSYVEQEYYETADGSGISGNNYYGRFGLPRSQVTTPGLFVDYSQPWGERVQLGAGGRLDWISVRAVDSPVFNIGSFFGGLDPKQNYTLPSGYLNGKLHLTHAWTLAAGFGYAERAPTPTDLYAKTFLEVLQPGAVTDFRGSLVGTTPVRLAPEKVRHLDLSLELKQDFIRGGLHGFHAWIEDFVTYRGSLTQFQTVNTNATLVGAEATGEVDVAPRWVVFGSLGYVRGQDLVLDEPLWGVPPMDTRLGFRLHALPADTPFGVEWAARIVDRQDRVATKMFGTSWAQEQPTPAFTTYDVRGYCQLTRTVQLLAGIENLTNKFYQEHLDARNDLSHASPGGVFRRGRTFYIGFDAAY